jgi:hypothetical protein
MQNTARISEIDAQANAERVKVESLGAKVEDAGLKDMLKRPRFMLDDVQHLLLPWAAKAQTARAADQFIGMAAMTLKLATDYREAVEEIVSKPGHDAQTI